MHKDTEVKIIFKEKDNNGDHESMTTGDVDIKTADKIYEKVILKEALEEFLKESE